MTNGRGRERLRDVALLLLAMVLAVAVVSIVLDGGRPAFAADDCQYGPYGPYGGPCTKVTPALTTAPQPAGMQIGSYAYDRATLSGGNAPTGTLTFAFYRPSDTACTNAAFTWASGVYGNGDYYSGSYQVDSAGTWRWTVAYSGDAQNEAVTSGCSDELVTVSRATPGINFWPSGTTIGSTLYASGYGYGGFQPTGTVTVRLYRPSDPACAGVPASTQTFPWYPWGLNLWTSFGPADALGTWRYTVDYTGDTNNNGVSLACGTLPAEVVKASPYVGANVSPGSVTIGGEVTVNGQVYNGYELSGTVRIRFFAPGDPGCSSPFATQKVALDTSGSFSTTFTPAQVGTWWMTADYGGDAFNNPSGTWCGGMSVEVSKASPGVSPAASPTSAATGGRLQAFALVRGGYQPGGRVSFRLYRPDDATCAGLPAYIEEANVSAGAASTTTGFVVPSEGTWRWQAVYLGDGNNNGTTSGCDEAPVSVAAKLGTPPRDPGGTPFVVKVYGNCVVDHDIGVPYGSRLVLRTGWATKTENQLKGFLSGSATRAVVDGVPVGNANRYWGKPSLGTGEAPWASSWEYDTGRVITAFTQPFTVDFQVVATKAGTDGFGTWSAGDVLISIGGPCLVSGFQP